MQRQTLARQTHNSEPDISKRSGWTVVTRAQTTGHLSPQSYALVVHLVMRCKGIRRAKDMVRSSVSVGAPSVIGANVGALTDCLHTHRVRVGWFVETKLAMP